VYRAQQSDDFRFVKKRPLVMLTSLYPPITPYNSGFLKVSYLHDIYWEECGNPQGVPILFIHGGPGAGISPIHRCFFDPQFYRIILFDQRGAGRSKPIAECRENTTNDLIDDIESLRVTLNVDRWLIFGGSWGSTLALAYGQTYPNHCAGFILRGIFLGSQWEIDWFLNGMGTFFPEAKRKFLGLLSEDESKNPLVAYLARLNDPSPTVHNEAAHHWSAYEQACSTLKPFKSGPDLKGSANESLALARIEAHYFAHHNFLKTNALLEGINKINSKPAFIIQGRYDVVCPIYSADKLANQWPVAKYEVIEDAGHSALEPGIRLALLNATEDMKTLGNF